MRTRNKRTGAVLPLVALCCVAIIAMVALAIDIGMIAIARTQCQNAADSSAMAGARTISGDVDEDYNLEAVPTKAVEAAISNSVLAQAVDGDLDNVTSVEGSTDTYKSGQVTIEAGSYTYTYNDADSSKEGFSMEIPRTDDTEPYSAVRSTISFNGSYAFARIFGQTAFNTSATATAVHRPRDVVIVMDLSGSMRFQSLPGIPHSGSRTTSMNPDDSYPQWGHYSDTANAGLYGNSKVDSGSEIAYYDPANISVETDSGPPVIEYFFANGVGEAPSVSNRAFARSTVATNSVPGGDNFLKTSLNTATTYAHTVREFNNNSSTTIPKYEVNGHAHYTTTFNGYTEGPGYWGKTFWIWPPNPCGLNVTTAPSSMTDTAFNWYNNGSRDWRQRFFVAERTSNGAPAWIQHNTILFNSSGTLRTPGTSTSVTENGTSVSYTFRINYAAILYWLTQSPNPFPDTMQAGRIRYYEEIPDGTDNTLNNRWWTTNPANLDSDERLWKEYIDFVLGYSTSWSGSANTYSSISARIGNGDYYTWTGSSLSSSSVEAHPQPQPPSTSPSDPYMTGTTSYYQATETDPYQTAETGWYMNRNVSSSRSSGSTSVPVSSLPATPVQNVNYVQFSNHSTVYLITNSSTSSLSISPSLTTSVSTSTVARILSTNNSSGKNKVSISNPSLTDTVTANSDYVGFGNSTTNLYKITSSTSKSVGHELLLNSNLVSSVSAVDASAQVYSSNGAVGATKMSTANLSSPLPTVNTDYVGFGGNTTNIYKITGFSQKSGSGAGDELTLGTGLVTAVNVNGTSTEIYASNGSIGSTRISVSGLTAYSLSSTNVNRDYIILNNDTANPYLITGVTAGVGSGRYILTISPGLVSAVPISGASVKVYSPHMEYDNDVRRPKHQFWFGAQTFVDWLGNYNTGKFGWPGNVPEAQSWSCKVGIQTAIDDIKKNHPSDFVAMAFFSHPTGKQSNGNWYDGYHNRAIVPLGRNYQQLKDSLWFPPTTVTGGVTEIGPYDADFDNVPRAVGGTTPEMGFMLAYNILSNSTSNLRLYSEPKETYRGNAGGLGRKGANRMIIFETDGAPNRCATAAFKSDSVNSYYEIRLKNPEDVYDELNTEIPVVTTTNSYSAASNAAYAVVQQICKDESEGGHSSARRPVQIYSLGYGSLFESANAGTNQDDAKKFLQTLQYHSGTATTTSASDFPDEQLVYGTSAQRIERMRVAFTSIMQKGVQVSLIE